MRFEEFVRRLNRGLLIVAGFAISFMMLITVADTVLRYFKMPIVGTYELVGLAAAVVLGFSIPYTTFVKGHIVVDFFVMKFKPKVKKFWLIVTRVMGLFLFSFMGYEMILMANDFRRSGEVSATLKLPFYYVAYGIGICLLFQVLTLLLDTYRAVKEEER